jgi:hypothetical protein
MVVQIIEPGGVYSLAPINPAPESFKVHFTKTGTYTFRTTYKRKDWFGIGRTRRRDFHVESRYPSPTREAQPVTWCGPNVTQTVHIRGIDNLEKDCFFTGSYRYTVPTGWSIGGTSQNEIITSSRFIDVTTPSIVDEKQYSILVEPMENGQVSANHPAGEIKAIVNIPDAPNCSIIGPKPSLCAGQVNYISLANCDQNLRYKWSASIGNVQVEQNYSTSLQFTPPEGSSSVRICVGVESECGNVGAEICRVFSVTECFSTPGPKFDENGHVVGIDINGGDELVWGISPSFPRGAGMASYWTKFQLFTMGTTANKDVYDEFDIGFLMVPDTGFADSMMYENHDMGVTYEVKLKNLSNGLIEYSKFDSTQVSIIKTDGLDLNSYQLIVVYDTIVLTDTIHVKSSCTGNCFVGISPTTGQSTEFYPVFAPNPTSGSGFLQLSFLEDIQIPPVSGHNIGFIYDVDVYDLQGNPQISFTNLQLQEIALDISSLSHGTYVAKITGGGGSYSSVFIHN